MNRRNPAGDDPIVSVSTGLTLPGKRFGLPNLSKLGGKVKVKSKSWLTDNTFYINLLRIPMDVQTTNPITINRCKVFAMHSLSAVIITYNEARNIRRCLESILPVSDEIVVVDCYSSDETQSICRDYPVRFIQHPFEGYIEQTRYATSQAAHDHILTIDADECLTEELRRSILEKKRHWDLAGYKMNRLTNYCGRWVRHSGWYPEWKLRLYDRTRGEWRGTNPHYSFKVNPGEQFGYIKGDMLHYSYTSISDHVARTNKYSQIMADEYFKQGKSCHLVIILGHGLHKFFKDYVLKKGFLDGYTGLLVCLISAFGAFLKYAKLRENYEQSSR